MRSVTPTVLYTKVNVQCDKLATDDLRQFITLSVHLSWQNLRRVTVQNFGQRSTEKYTLIFAEIQSPFQNNVG